MDMVTKMGGRKFLMAMLAIGIATYLEVSGKGLSLNMAGFLITVVGAFSVTNLASTSKYLSSKSPRAYDSVHEKLDDMKATLDKTFDPSAQNDLTGLLVSINDRLNSVTETTGLLAKTVVNLGAKR